MENSILSNKTIIYLPIKRLFDIIVSLVGIIFIIPIYIIIKISYILNKDYSSVIFVQKRIGKNGEEFNLFKFRTMVPNAEEVLKDLLKDPKYKKEWDKNQKFDNDPRITKIGKIIRKLSLDESPQFINLLIGDMSLIGPRPLVKGELDKHKGNHKIYEALKPGLTGWWACNGRSCTSYKKRLELEYFYIKNCSIFLDIKCLLKTVYVVIKRDGAK